MGSRKTHQPPVPFLSTLSLCAGPTLSTWREQGRLRWAAFGGCALGPLASRFSARAPVCRASWGGSRRAWVRHTQGRPVGLGRFSAAGEERGPAACYVTGPSESHENPRCACRSGWHSASAEASGPRLHFLFPLPAFLPGRVARFHDLQPWSQTLILAKCRET